MGLPPFDGTWFDDFTPTPASPLSPPVVFMTAFSDLVLLADRKVQGNLGGEPVIYTPQVGAPVTVTGVYDEVYVLAKGDPLAGVETLGPAVFLRLEDLPVDPEFDEPILTIHSLDYRVIERRPDGIGGIVLALRLVT